MDPSGLSNQPRFETALKRCAGQIDWYERHAGRARIFYRTFQSAVVVLAGLTPVLALWKMPEQYAVLPAAVASVVAAIVGLWGGQENWVRFAATAEALKSELVKFQTRTSNAYRVRLDEESVLDNFVARIEGLTSGELVTWSARQSQRKPAGSEPG